MTSWVLLRGLTRERAHWGGFAAQLAAGLPGARVVGLDLPGAGALRQQRCPLRVEAMVEACRLQLRAAGLAPPWHVLGLSLGGMVATAWAVAYPAELAGCVLVNTSLGCFSPPQHRLRIALWPALAQVLLAKGVLRAETAVLRLTSSQPERRRDVLAAWCETRRKRPVTRLNALRQGLAAARYRGPLRAPGLPVLVASSAADRLVDPACSLRIAAAWHADHVVHPVAGHDLPLDDGPWLVSQIAAWQGLLQR